MVLQNYLLTQMASNFVQKFQFQDYKITIQTTASLMYPLAFFFKKHSVFRLESLVDLHATDVLEKKKRFFLTYHLKSKTFNSAVFIHTRLAELSSTLSLVSLFLSSNWPEREIWDLFGLRFFLHPNLRRILTDYGFSGFPLRKDYPLSGFLEIAFNKNTKRLSYRRVVLSQEYRNFFFEHFFNYWDFKKYKKYNFISINFGVLQFFVLASCFYYCLSKTVLSF